jgi:4-amino-4-deoxy-L-arabinose transferase-like glycosyltransferase
MKKPAPHTAAVWLILALALALRIGYVAITPDYTLVHDALDYDNAAQSIAQGEGWPTTRGHPGRETAFRPPAYPVLLAGVYKVASVERASNHDQVRAARILGIFISTLIVGLIGVVAAQLWGRRVALAAMGLAAVYIPLIVVGAAVMSEPLFAALLLGALAAAIQQRRSAHRWRWVILAGVLGGLTILTRANAMVLLLPLALAVWTGRPRFSVRSLAVPAMLVLLALVTVSPWTIRNAVVFDRFIPVSTQLGSALAGTYNEQAYADKENPASWRSIRHVPSYRELYSHLGEMSEPAVEDILRKRSKAFIREHPAYVGKVALWTTLRTFELGGLDWSRHTAGTISVSAGWANAGVVCFWIFALLALAGATTKAARRTPLWVWLVPLLLYLSVVFLVVETPRYRTGIDPFIVMLAAVGVTQLRRTPRASEAHALPPLDRARYPTSPTDRTPA